MDISVVIPAFNEAESLPALCEELLIELQKLGLTYEIIIVNDGSTDDSARIADALSSRMECLDVINLTRRHGKSYAYKTGFQRASGDYIVTMDADLQDDPSELENLINSMQREHAECVIGRKTNRIRNEFWKKVPSYFFNVLTSFLFQVNIAEQNSGFRILTSRLAKALPLRGDNYRFIPFLALSYGYKVIEVPVRHRKRLYGHSKFGAFRFCTGLLDVISIFFVLKYSNKPLHFFGIFGLLLLVTGAAFFFWVIYAKLFLGSFFRAHTAAMLAGTIFLLMGSQSILLGLLGELVISKTDRTSL